MSNKKKKGNGSLLVPSVMFAITIIAGILGYLMTSDTLLDIALVVGLTFIFICVIKPEIFFNKKIEKENNENSNKTNII